MQLAMDTGMLEIPKLRVHKTIFLTDRDYKILIFILEMKFSSVKNVYDRFFRINLLGNESITFRAAYRRLSLLEEYGFLNSTRNFEVNEKIYYPTPRAYFLIQGKVNFMNSISYPIKKIDSRTFTHDSLLIDLRSQLEQKENVSDWVSDRYLKSKPEYTDLSKLNIVPDGIYKTTNNDYVAFELELTLKSKARYASKIKSFVQYLRSQKVNNTFSKVRFVCAKEAIKRILEAETRLYKDYFQIELLEQFTNKKGKAI